MQEIAWSITWILIGLVAIVFWWVISAARRPSSYEQVARRAYAWRGKLFWLTLAVGAVITVTTLRPWPYPSVAAATPTQVVEVMAAQWSWQMSTTELKAGEPVEFRVNSRDVNHGFGIYDSSLRLLAQVQAMPGYTNILRYTFTQPGEYQVLCMEYCGVAHHGMTTTFNIVPVSM